MMKPLLEIEYRAWWLANNPDASRDVVDEELDGIRRAVERAQADERTTAGTIARIATIAERVEWLVGSDRGTKHLRLVTEDDDA